MKRNIGDAERASATEWGDGVRADGTLSAHVPCRQCGYDLITLHSTGDCPECGLPIRETIIDERRGGRRTAWQRAARHGAWLLVLCAATWGTAALNRTLRGTAGRMVDDQLSLLSLLLVMVSLGSLSAVVVRMVRERQFHVADVLLCLFYGGAVWIALMAGMGTY